MRQANLYTESLCSLKIAVKSALVTGPILWLPAERRIDRGGVNFYKRPSMQAKFMRQWEFWIYSEE